MSSMLAGVASNSFTWDGSVVQRATSGMRTKTGCGRRSKKVSKRSSQSWRLASHWNDGVGPMPPMGLKPPTT